MLEVLFFCIVVQVVIEPGIIDSIYVDVSVGMGKGFLEEGVVLLGVSGVSRV